MQHADNELLELATLFRRAVEASIPQLPEWMQSFPLGQCGTASDLLACWLIANGVGPMEYVNGRRVEGSGPTARVVTHGWLEVDDWIVDVTADQFDGDLPPVIVTRDRRWHGAFGNQERRPADADLDASFVADDLKKAYELIERRVKSSVHE